jgi:3-oxoacyl-[acyl-carrier-protein] synthase III
MQQARKTMDGNPAEQPSFFNRPGVQLEQIQVGRGVPLGIEQVFHPEIGIGGAYGSWGESYDNQSLRKLIEERSGEPLREQEIMNLAELGFLYRHHLSDLNDEEHIEVEEEVGVRFLRAAINACEWDPGEVDAVLIGSSGPATDDYVERISAKAGIPASSLKVSIHKACDSSMGGLHMLLNPTLPIHARLGKNLAEELYGKKVLIGGIEGLSRFLKLARDKNALQLFGNGAGVIGIIPGQTMKFLAGKTHEVYDEEGVLAVHMYYPHSRQRVDGQSMIEAHITGENHFRVAGLMHEPESDAPVEMAGLMGMVKLFVRTGVQVMQDVYREYQARMAEFGRHDHSPAVAIVHHANYKINMLIEKHLQREGIRIQMPWLLSDFGNVSAASNMIAFLRKLSELKPQDHVLFNGFGAGTYYDALAVELGG